MELILHIDKTSGKYIIDQRVYFLLKEVHYAQLWIQVREMQKKFYPFFDDLRIWKDEISVSKM